MAYSLYSHSCASFTADPIVLKRFAEADSNVVLVSVDVGDRATYVPRSVPLDLHLKMLHRFEIGLMPRFFIYFFYR